MTFVVTSLFRPPPPRPNVNFVANHPFTFAMISRNNDVVFIGRLLKF